METAQISNMEALDFHRINLDLKAGRRLGMTETRARRDLLFRHRTGTKSKKLMISFVSASIQDLWRARGSDPSQLEPRKVANLDFFFLNIFQEKHKAVTYDHRLRKIGHPVRSAIHKPQIGRLVVGWVTTSEYLLLYVFGFFFFLLLAIEWKPKKQEELSFSLVSVDNELSRQCCIFCSRHLFTFLDLPV